MESVELKGVTLIIEMQDSSSEKDAIVPDRNTTLVKTRTVMRVRS
jgi:hypothetical protein